MAFKGYGSWLNPILGGSQPAKPDGGLSGDDAKARFEKSPDILKKVVEEERARHTKCATDEKPFRVDVERILDAKICYLNFTCAGCYLDKRVQVWESTGQTMIVKDEYVRNVYYNTTGTSGESSVIKDVQIARMTKEQKIAENVKANAQGRAVTYAPIYMPKIEIDQSLTELRKATYAASTEPFRYERKKREPKAAKPTIDRLRIVRAAPVHDEEV